MLKVQHERQKMLNAIVGKRIASATSSLTSFAIKFDDASGIIFEAGETANPGVMSPIVAATPGAMSAIVDARLVNASEVPALEEAVCSVDWSWICGSIVQHVDPENSSVRLKLKPAGPLTIGAAFWQGKPFLSFQPHKPVMK